MDFFLERGSTSLIHRRKLRRQCGKTHNRRRGERARVRRTVKGRLKGNGPEGPPCSERFLGRYALGSPR